MMNMTRSRKTFLSFSLAAAMISATMAPASTAIFDKTRFVADLGIAYYCFHHWVSAPAKNGAFASGAPHRTASIVKAGGALLFAVNRVKAANKIAHTSKDKTLQKLSAGLDEMTSKFTSLGTKFKSGKMDAGDSKSLNDTFSNVDGEAKANKISIKDTPVAVPGM